MEKSYYLYAHISPSGKYYIGITSADDPNKRWGNGNGYKNNEYFARAIKKYGWDCFKHVILCSGLSKEEAENMEREYIERYQSNKREFGYNITNGGESGKKHSAESKKKMSDAKVGKYIGSNNPRYGVKPSDKTIEKIRQSNIGRFAGNKNPNYGKHISDDQKKKISNARKGKHYPRLSESVKNSKLCIEVREKQKIKIDQYTLNGEYIRTWDSASDASTALLGHRMGQSNICSCSNGKIKTAYGYIWKHHMGEGSDEET